MLLISVACVGINDLDVQRLSDDRVMWPFLDVALGVIALAITVTMVRPGMQRRAATFMSCVSCVAVLFGSAWAALDILGIVGGADNIAPIFPVLGFPLLLLIAAIMLVGTLLEGRHGERGH